jgi:hypothetical protein
MEQEHLNRIVQLMNEASDDEEKFDILLDWMLQLQERGASEFECCLVFMIFGGYIAELEHYENVSWASLN